MVTSASLSTNISDLKRREPGNEDLSKAELAEQKIAQQKKTFFKLLAVQLQNQDPTSPMDTNQMTAQIFTMNAVEQQLESNRLLEKIYDVLHDQQIAQPSANIGKVASYEGNSFKLSNSSGEFSYTLNSNLKSVGVEIKNQAGAVVYKDLLKTNIGNHTFQWNGEDSNGNKLPEGNYNFLITALDANDDPVSIKSFVSGKIDGIVSENNDFKYSIEGKEINKEKIRTIKDDNNTFNPNAKGSSSTESKAKETTGQDTDSAANNNKPSLFKHFLNLIS
ncbi:flagellar basal-body rod modification protein FlgD [endosymbiont of Acanthamoeba sp. UWC8]|uniref:flagellar hook assembly protein FlgD n=1 Tax=endosymbiont of Acanthamoeba sp. UWC8 TaxID=86106 RepID=UPI0004D1D985|nr:flagellar hook capping FlgD N-terminal domain-containing protein [endosymbiont of Acanthamoeba sp. UWC8]AIF81613.1 flagellar basal-body rod modification protein FlgD [endosymbiont of Acanthamoeba sp. UWC8]